MILMLSSTALSSAKRIEQHRFTEADVKAVIIEVREKGFDSPIKEIGDLIAHPKKDRGDSRDHLIMCYAQVAKFTKYQSNHKENFPNDGSCDWWLKPLLKGQIDNFKDKDIRKTLGKNKKYIKKELRSYFPDNEQFPTELVKGPDRRFFEIINKMFSIIKSSPPSVFEYGRLRNGITKLLESLSINSDKSLIDNLIVCICIIFHKSEFLLPHGETGFCKLNIEQG